MTGGVGRAVWPTGGGCSIGLVGLSGREFLRERARYLSPHTVMLKKTFCL